MAREGRPTIPVLYDVRRTVSTIFETREWMGVTYTITLMGTTQDTTNETAIGHIFPHAAFASFPEGAKLIGGASLRYALFNRGCRLFSDAALRQITDFSYLDTTLVQGKPGKINTDDAESLSRALLEKAAPEAIVSFYSPSYGLPADEAHTALFYSPVGYDPHEAFYGMKFALLEHSSE